MAVVRSEKRELRRGRVRRKAVGNDNRPRLSVFRSLHHIYVQVISDESGRTLAAASTETAGVRENLKNVPLFLRQIFYVHWFYIVLIVGLFSALCFGFARDLAAHAVFPGHFPAPSVMPVTRPPAAAGPRRAAGRSGTGRPARARPPGSARWRTRPAAAARF